MPTTERQRSKQAGRRSPTSGRARLALVGILLAAVVFGTGGFLLLSARDNYQPGQTAAVSIGGPFTLTDGNGKQVTDRDFRGKYLLVYFGYTFCPDVCPTTLNQVAAAMQKLGAKAEQVQPLFVTIDPQRDTPSVVRQYAAAFDARLIGLTGTPEQVAQIAREYRVYYAVHRTGSGASDYTMDHSSVIYLIGPDGRFVAPIRADASGNAIAADVAKHLS